MNEKQPLSFWPEHFTRKYWIVSLVVLVLLLANPGLYVDTMKAVLLLIYGSIVTPLFEELVFRGYVWNRLEGIYEKPNTVMVLNALLFGVWHLGYIITPLMNGEWMALSKLVIGFAFGMILGFVRMKTKNCYSTFLVHGLLNSFCDHVWRMKGITNPLDVI